MIKSRILELYKLYVEKIFLSNDKEKIKKTWEKVKQNYELLNYAAKLNGNEFTSNIIVTKILEDKSFYNQNIYHEIINKIYSNKIIAQTQIKNTNTFLTLTLENKDLNLTKKQKAFLILEAENSPFTLKTYVENTNKSYIHGVGAFDIRFKILQNKNFNIQQKKNFFIFFYPDDEVKIIVLRELEWEIINLLNIPNDGECFDDIYRLSYDDIKEIINNKDKALEIVDKINLCKHIKSTIPENSIRRYINNE